MALRTFLSLIQITSAANLLLQYPIARDDSVKVDDIAPSTLATAKVSLINSVGPEVKSTLIHQRGNLDQSKEVFEWGYVGLGGSTQSKTYTFESLRKDFDMWQVGLQFRNPDWTIWTNEWEDSPPANDANLTREIIVSRETVVSQFGKDIKRATLSRPGKGFPSDTTLNTFCTIDIFRRQPLPFVRDFNVTLAMRGNGKTKQIQVWKFDERGEVEEAVLPFFFDGNASKTYSETLDISVTRRAAPPLKATSQPCKMTTADLSSVGPTLKVNLTHWSLGYGYYGAPNVTEKCVGRWMV